MELLSTILSRRSVRRFKDQPISSNILDDMLEAVRHAPSPGNSQGYCFGVIKDQAVKEKLAHAAGEQMWIATAPIVFACCADISWDLVNQPEDDFGMIVNKLRFNNDFLKYVCDYPDSKARMTLFENGSPLIVVVRILKYS